MNIVKRHAVCAALTVFLLSLTIPNAYGWILNDCGALHVRIHNATSGECTLIGDPEPTHGVLTSGMPTSIPAGQLSAFTLDQAYYYGPDIKLLYQCGTKHIQLQSQQNFCVTVPGMVTGRVRYQDNGITATHTGTEGGHSTRTPGTSAWSIKFTR